MGKTSKKKHSEIRKAAKKARKGRNYLRYGPKQGHTGRRQKKSRYGTFKAKNHGSRGPGTTPPGIKGRRRRQGLSTGSKRTKLPKRPLRPLRRRRRLSSGDIGAMRGRR